jgi:hypothetical protein
MAGRSLTGAVADMLRKMPAEQLALAEELLARVGPELARMLVSASTETLEAALAAPTDALALARLVAAEGNGAGGGAGGETSALSPMTFDTLFKLAPETQAALIEDAGGAWKASEVAAHLGGISLQGVALRRRQKMLLAVEHEDTYLYPRCQFTETGVLPYLSDFLRALGSDRGWTELAVLLGPPQGGSCKTVLEALRSGDFENALHTARAWGGRAES